MLVGSVCSSVDVVRLLLPRSEVTSVGPEFSIEVPEFNVVVESGLTVTSVSVDSGVRFGVVILVCVRVVNSVTLMADVVEVVSLMKAVDVIAV